MAKVKWQMGLQFGEKANRKPFEFSRLPFEFAYSLHSEEGKTPLTRPTTAEENAVGGHPLPKGEG